MRTNDRLDEILEELKRLSRLMESPGPRLFKYGQAAKALGVSVTTVKQLIRDGELATVKIGKRPMIPMSEIERLSTPAAPKSTSSRAPRRRRGQRDAKAEAAALRQALKKL